MDPAEQHLTADACRGGGPGETASVVLTASGTGGSRHLRRWGGGREIGRCLMQVCVRSSQPPASSPMLWGPTKLP